MAPQPDDRSGSGRTGRNLPLAIATGLILAGLLFATIFTSTLAFLALVAAAVLIAQAELYRALAQRGMRASMTIGLAGGAVMLIAAYGQGARGLGVGLVLGILGTLLWFVLDPERDGVRDGVAATLLGLLYPVLLAAHVVMLIRLPGGPMLTIAYIGAVAFYDIGAYAAGVLVGKHPLHPLSPKKTWEGAAGATALVFVLALAVGPHLGPLTLGSALALAGITVVLAPLGDLAESMIKRDLEIKDMGSLLPGHGGLMDRIDALLLVAPAAYWMIAFVVV